MGLFIAGERTLETLVLEGLAWWSGNVVWPFWLALLNNVHLDSKECFSERRMIHSTDEEMVMLNIFLRYLFAEGKVCECDPKGFRSKL